MEKKNIKFGMSDALVINDLVLKSKIIDFLFSSIDLSQFRYNMLNNIQRLQFLKENEHYVSPNFMGYNYLLLFLSIDNIKYCVAVDKKRLSYHKNQVQIKKVNMYKILVNATSSVFRGTIFDCKLIYEGHNSGFRYFMLIKDCYYLMGNKTVDIEMLQKMTHIDNVIRTQFTNGSKCKNFVFKINKLNKYSELRDIIEKYIPNCKVKCQGLEFYPTYSGINVVYIEKSQEKVGITNNNLPDDKIEAKSYDLIINMTEYLKNRKYSYELNGKIKKLWIKDTEIPDVFDVFEEKDTNKLGIAHIPNLKISHMCRNNIIDGSVRYNCRFDKDFKKWIPIEVA